MSGENSDKARDLKQRRDAMAESLARMEEKNGPTDQTEVARLEQWLVQPGHDKNV